MYIFVTWNFTVNNRTVKAFLREYKLYIKHKRTKVRHNVWALKALKSLRSCQTPLQVQAVTSSIEKHWEQLLQHLFFVSGSLSRRWLAPWRDSFLESLFCSSDSAVNPQLSCVRRQIQSNLKPARFKLDLLMVYEDGHKWLCFVLSDI